MAGEPSGAHARALLAAGVVVFAWWAMSLRPFTGPALVAVLAGGTAALLWGRQGRRVAARVVDPVGVAAWGVLAAALSGWQLASYLQHPRTEHPTISSLVDGLLDPWPVRTIAFVGWLAVAAWLGRR